MKVLNQENNDYYSLYQGDSCEIMKGIPDNSIGLSIFSPPFSSLYVYNDTERDLGNSKDDDEFSKHFKFIIKELNRILKPGRHACVHCANMPAMKERDGYIGLKDFRGEIIRSFQDEGFIYHSEVCIWKNPVVEMQRTKSLGLLHKQIKKDSSRSRMGLCDYIVVMRKDGVNTEPIQHTNENFTVDKWQEWASPVWMDISQGNTLQRESAREEKDEKHICPLQLDVIERCIELWSNQGDVVFSPFAGIGSEIYQAILQGRKGIGIELKESYYKQAVLNCNRAVEKAGEGVLFK
jgi:DNA modification methylase